MAFISDGNTKLIGIPNISMTPVKSCRNSSACKSYCCAIRPYRMYGHVRKDWDNNFTEAVINPEKYFNDIRWYLIKKRPKFFSWHTSGDILDQEYLDEMIRIAEGYYFIRFLVLTKMYYLSYNNIPDNLSIIFSAWPGLNMPYTDLPVAFVRFSKDEKFSNTIECTYDCSKCHKCWYLKKLSKNVVFNKH